MRVFVESDMTVCPDGHTLNLRAGETVEGPLARYLANSGCEVTIEEDDRPAVDPAVDPEPDAVSHVPGGATVEQEAVPEPEPEGAEAEPGAAA